MQDIHSIGSGGGVGRLFGGGERRLKPHHHHHQGYGDGHQALKCPRCHSLNTKFCYYNNYNLSQPRHFCKGCRRYWTKGGVLRNVPVGGGCRKTNRSKQKSNNSKPSSVTVAPTSERKSADSQNSCSDSSSLTANATAATATATTTKAKASTVAEVLSGSNSTNSAAQPLFNFQDSSTTFYNAPQSSAPNPGFDPPVLDQCSADNNHMFSEIGTFRSLITSSSDQLPLDFNPAPEISSFMHQQAQKVVADNPNANQEQWLPPTVNDGKMQEIGSAGFMDQTGQVEYSRTSNGGLAAEDWQGDTEQSLFDLPGSVDQSYWGEIPWNNRDHQLNYFP